MFPSRRGTNLIPALEAPLAAGRRRLGWEERESGDVWTNWKVWPGAIGE